MRDLLSRLLAWEDAHVGFDAAVGGLTPPLRGVAPPGLPHSPWQLLEHLRRAQHDILDFCLNADYRELTWPDDYWPAAPEPPSERAWNESVEAFRADRTALQRLALDPTVDLTPGSRMARADVRSRDRARRRSHGLSRRAVDPGRRALAPGARADLTHSNLERNGTVSRSGPDLHGQTELFEAPNETAGDLGFVSTLEIVGAEFVVRGLILQDVVRGGQDGGGDGEDRLLGSAPTLETKKLRAEVRVAGAGRHPRDLDERGFEPRVAGSGPRGEPLAGTFLLAGTEAGPRDQVASGGKPAHVEADFRHDDARDRASNRGNRHQSVDGGLKGREGLTQARLHLAHRGVERIDLRQMQAQEESVMRRHPALQCRDDGGTGRFQSPLTEVGEPFGILFAANDRLDHRASAHPHHVADDAGQLQVGILEHLLDAQRVLGDFADQLLPRARQIAEFVDRRGRHKAAANQPVGQQVGNPHGIVHVGLATRHAADVQRVRQDELELPVQHVPDRLPVDAGRLHRDMRAPVRREPVRQRQQIAGRRAERAHLLLDRRPGRDACAGDDGLLMHVESGTARIQDLHRDLLGGVSEEPASSKSRRRALRSATGGNSLGCSRGSGSD